MKLLYVEDSERLRRSLSHGLRQVGYTVDLAADGEQALSLLKMVKYPVIILDLMLPKLDGLSVLREIRARASESSVLILSARDQVNDRVQGLEMGADDYLVKPFAFEELCARLKAIKRRNLPNKDAVVHIGNVKLDLDAKQVYCRQQSVHLTGSEYALLECLVLQRGRVLSKTQLMDWLYEIDTGVSTNMIEVLLSAVRRKLKTACADNIIETRRGFGYTVPI